MTDEKPSAAKLSDVPMPSETFLPGDSIQGDEVPQWVCIVCIVLGILGLLCWGGQGLMMMVPEGLASEMPEPSPDFRGWMYVQYFAGVILGIWLIVAGSGGLSGASWARSAVRWWAWVRLLLALISILVAWQWFDEVVDQSMVSMRAEMAAAPDLSNDNATTAATDVLPRESVEIFTGFAMALQTLAVCLWPVLALITTRRRGSG